MLREILMAFGADTVLSMASLGTEGGCSGTLVNADAG